jgi:SAM-dependent methyltransferase
VSDADPTTIGEVPFHFEHAGHCPMCDKNTQFVAKGPFFRDTLKCTLCKSGPRQRAMMHAIATFCPNWRKLAIHEGSPGWDNVSVRLAAECGNYTASHYDPSVSFGTLVHQPKMPCKVYRSEDLEAMTLDDNQFDLFVTQDVFEHIYHPNKAISEIARVLKPGGATILTVPIVCKTLPSRRRAMLKDGENVNLLPPEFHGNPMGGGSVVTIDWGYDIAAYLAAASGLNFILLQIDNIDLGLRADFNDVLIGFKRPLPVL